MKRDSRFARVLHAVQRYLIFFLTVAFVTTCCMMLFVTVFSETVGIALTGENLADAAKVTFLNVLLLSFLYSLFDTVRRRLTVDRPVKRITEAAEKVMQGDLSVRIRPSRNSLTEARFNDIVDCFNRMTEELSGVETLRTDFISNVSHEMKTPLAVMQNYGTLLQEPGLSEEKRLEYAKTISENCRKLSDLISNILKLNRLENQQIYPQRKEYNLSEQLCECLLAYESVWERAEIDIETDIAEDVMIREDEELLSVVWNNLFSNAFKFTEPGGKVSVSLKTEGSSAVVTVTDTGCGMSPETGAHIFEKFYQGDTSRSTAGNGLGLPLVKRIMDITGGEISVSSTPGAGSTFTVHLLRHP